MRSTAKIRQKQLQLATGTFNEVYVLTQPEAANPDSNQPKIYWVRKYPRNNGTPNDVALSHPLRAVAIWRQINPDLPVRIAPNASYWEIPYITGTTPTVEEVANTVIDIYRRTGYIMIDAVNYQRRNFIRTHDGKVICIDVDLALLKDENTSQFYLKNIVFNGRSLSPVYNHYFSRHYNNGMQKVVAIITNLLYSDLLPDELNAEYPQEEKEDEKVSLLPASINRTNTSTPRFSPAKSIFLKLHQREMLCTSFTKIKHDGSQSLAEIVTHAQRDKRLFGWNVRTANLMQKMGWLDRKNKVIAGSGLDLALESEGLLLENIAYDSKPMRN